MKLKTRDLAKYLSKTNEEVVKMLLQIGIIIEDVDRPLTNSQIKVLKDFINKKKPPKENKIFSNSLEDEKYILTRKKKYRLLEKIGDGGEGIIYKIDEDLVCKIYKKIDLKKIEKLKLIIKMNMYCEGVCFPLELAYNNSYEPIGYIMKKAKGLEMQKSLMGKKQIENYFQSFKKREMVELSITILEKIEYLHNKQIILGDINPMNILVVSSREVYFVDTDSYQVGNFPCSVGTTLYTAPEIQRKNFAGFLRNFGNEYFSIASLLFMIMVPGKPPYSRKGGEDIIENILKMDFVYPLRDRESRNIPSGPWMYCWSHLPIFIKKAFYKSFKKGEEFNDESTRLNVYKWKDYMHKYLELIDNGEIKKKDSISLEIFPTRYINDGKEFEYEEENKYRVIFRKLLNI